jgi:Zn-dependent protease/CBS domain-containing protein
LRLGSIAGIEIGVNYTWLIVFGLITWSLATTLPTLFPGWTIATYWLVGAISAFLLFGSVLVHELAHSLVAKSRGIRVKSITLFIFGGVSNFAGEPRRASDEFYTSIVGPLTSLALGGLFWVLLQLLRGISPQLTATLLYLAIVNVALALFNLIPAFPLDGGRVFRSIAWGLLHNLHRATRIATSLGVAFSYLFILAGLFMAFTGDFLGGIWLVFIGWFLNSAAEASYQQLVVQETFRRIRVADVMNPQPMTVQPRTTVHDLVEQYVLRRSIRSLPVVQDGTLDGIVTLTDVKKVPRERWETTTVAQIMTPMSRTITIAPTASLQDALECLAEHDLNQLPVVQDRELVGLLSRDQILRFFRVREELGSTAA